MADIVDEIKLDFKDVLLRPKKTDSILSRSEINLFREVTFRNSKQIFKGIPIIASCMFTIGTFEMAKALSKHGMFTMLHKYYPAEECIQFANENKDVLSNIIINSGLADGDFERLSKILETVPEIRFISLDVPNGYIKPFVEHVSKVRAAFPSHTIIAGTVVTGDITEDLIHAGADIVKVGMGSGSACTTRIMTGVGYPQLSSLMECAKVAHSLGGHVVSDGGCTSPGDVAKAFGGGADFVMIGGMFAGHDQSGGELREKPDGTKVKVFYGSASETALKNHDKLAEYRCPEGRTMEIPYRGDVNATVKELLGGLRSACSYIGATSIEEMPRRTTFIRCTQQYNPIFAHLAIK